MFAKPSLLLLGLTAAFSAVRVQAQEFDNNDVPQQCRSVCQSMVDAARTCDQTNDGDRQEVDCICNTEGASTALPECAACVRLFDSDNDDDDDDDDDNDENDIDEVMRSCSFSSTTFASGSATASSTGSNSGSITSSSSQSLITSVYTTTSTDIDDDPDDQDETRTLTRTTVFAADASPTNDSNTGSNTNAADSATSNAGGSAEAATSSAGDAASTDTSDSGAAVVTGLPLLGAGAGALVVAVAML